MLREPLGPACAKVWNTIITLPMHKFLVSSLLCASALSAPPLLAQARNSCRPADSEGYGLVTYLKTLATATDRRQREARDSFYHVPVVPASQIVLVSDHRACRRAAQALTKYEDGNPGDADRRQVVVVSLGRNWAVTDPDEVTRYQTVVIFNSKWKQIGGYSGP
jgi:hypothetical protein